MSTPPVLPAEAQGVALPVLVAAALPANHSLQSPCCACFCLKPPDLIYTVDSSTLNSRPAAPNLEPE